MALRILLIEDSSTYRELATMLLEADGHSIIPARTGGEGVRLAASERPDLILTDMHLPDMDGFQVIQRLKQDERSARIPTVALTGDTVDDDAEQEKGRIAGFAGYVNKPIDKPAFRKMLDEFAGK